MLATNRDRLNDTAGAINGDHAPTMQDQVRRFG
jgi:hypothetical protein